MFSPVLFLPINKRLFEKGIISLFCHCLCFRLFFSFIPKTLTKQREYIDKNTSYKDYIETIYLKELFKSFLMETSTFHTTTVNVLILTLIYFVIARSSTALAYLCDKCLGK